MPPVICWSFVVLVVLAACGGEPSAGRAADAPTVALLLPETKTVRYETKDRPYFEERVRELCPECRVLYRNANQDPDAQNSQAEAVLSDGADVLVLDPVDSAAASTIVAKAKSAGVPVISYDRLVLDSDVAYYVSFDSEKVGELQAGALVERLERDGRARGTIVMINGAATDNNGRAVKRGGHRVFDRSQLVIGAEYDTPEWSPDLARQEMEQAITKLGRSVIAGVFTANDGMAGGAITAMKGAGLDPLPPVTGQDAELRAIQRIITGEQFMTVYKAIRPQADAAARLAVALSQGDPVPEGLVNAEVHNGRRTVPAVLLEPVVVTAATVGDTVVRDGFWSAEEICKGLTESCETAGIRTRPP